MIYGSDAVIVGMALWKGMMPLIQKSALDDTTRHNFNSNNEGGHTVSNQSARQSTTSSPAQLDDGQPQAEPRTDAAKLQGTVVAPTKLEALIESILGSFDATPACEVYVNQRFLSFCPLGLKSRCLSSC
jgi:hypothetical protein